MLNLIVQSKFRKYIKAGKPDKLPMEARDIINKIEKDISVNGSIIHPSTEISIFSTIFFGSIALFVIIGLLILLSDPLYIFQDFKFFIAFIFIVSYILDLTIIRDVVLPLWIKKHLKSYYIYIGEKGIIKRTLKFAAYIPYDKLLGAKVHVSRYYRAYPNVTLELIIKKGSLLNPNLITNDSAFYHDITEYYRNDLYTIADLINNKLNYIEPEKMKSYAESEPIDNNFFSNDKHINAEDIIKEYGFDSNQADTSAVLQEKFMLNGVIHKLTVKKEKNQIKIIYNDKVYQSADMIDNPYIRDKIKEMLKNL